MTIDLHTTLVGIGAPPEELWDVFSRETDALVGVGEPSRAALRWAGGMVTAGRGECGCTSVVSSASCCCKAAIWAGSALSV